MNVYSRQMLETQLRNQIGYREQDVEYAIDNLAEAGKELAERRASLEMARQRLAYFLNGTYPPKADG